MGGGEAAERWVRETNDARIIEALVAMEPDAAVARAATERSACSVGGALAAMGYAAWRGVTKGTLARYRTSRDVHRDPSFVGYAGIVYSL